MSQSLILNSLVPLFDRSYSFTGRALRSEVTASRATGTPSIAAAERGRAAINALRSALSDTQENGWDGYRAKPADPTAFVYAIQFLGYLPSMTQLPDIAVDPDGDISLEWDGGPRRIFSVRVSRDGTLYYSGLFGYATLHGSEQLGEGVPSPISEGISRVLSEPRLRSAS